MTKPFAVAAVKEATKPLDVISRESQARQSPERAAWGREVEAGGGFACGWSLPKEDTITVVEVVVED